MADPNGLCKFPEYQDVKVGDMISVDMPVANWLRLIGWGLGIEPDLPEEMNVIYSQVMQTIWAPRETKERMAHIQEHLANPLRGTPLEGLGTILRSPFGPPDGGDPRMDET